MKPSSLSAALVRGIAPALLLSSLCCPAGLSAQAASAPATDGDHIVTTQALQQQVQLSADERTQDIATVTQFLSTPIAQQTMKDSHIDPVQVRTAIPTLSDQELKELATRSTDAQQKFAAGGLTSLALTLIILGVIIIILVAIFH